MFSKSLIATAALCLSLSLQVHAHAAIFPALGVKGTPARSDVQRPSKSSECGKINIAQNIDSSQAIQAAANGSFSASIINFNGGVDGSRQVTALVDPTGTGKSFVSADVLQNGDKNPASTGTQQLVVQLPAGAACSGGASKNKCLVSFTTAGGFGNCVVVQQGAAGAAAAAGAGNATKASATTAAAAKQTKTQAKAKATKAKVVNAASASAAAPAASASASASPSGTQQAQAPAQSQSKGQAKGQQGQIGEELLKELQELEQEFAQAQAQAKVRSHFACR
ncbi:hypothetical protein OH77DRAFT_1410258 [Trametes cingulata]|nr:hypothetical protein OH77DRAFT_1410258 [Trametes cingulata]